MQFTTSGDDEVRRYSITGISGEQYDQLIKKLTLPDANTPVENRTGRWQRPDQALVVIVIAKGRSAAEADDYMREALGLTK